MKKLFLLSFLFLIFFAINTKAQNYNTAVGARLGYPLSASVKHFLNENNAIEGYVGFRGYSGYSWVSISGAYLHHKPIDDINGLQWYVGGGASAYFWNFDFVTSENSTTLGLQGYLGLDYTFNNTPISLTVDWVPTFFLSGFVSGFGAGYGSLGVRYILK